MKIIFSLLGVLLLAASIAAQEQKPAPLSLKLTPNRLAGCAGEEVKFTAVLKNISAEPVVIDPAQLGYSGSIFISPKPSRDARKGVGQGIGRTWIGHHGDPYEPVFMILRPGETFEKIIRRTIEKEFRDQVVRFRTSYGQFQTAVYQGITVWRDVIDSNEVEISYRKCRGK